jgi:hypothetical protein
VAQGTVAKLRGRARQRIEVWFARVPPTAELSALPGVVDPIIDDRRCTATLSGSIEPPPRVLTRQHIVLMLVEEPDLEGAFLDLYGDTA